MIRGFLFIVVCIIGIYIGAAIATYIFMGILTLLGLVFLIEAIKPLKWLVERSVSILDIIIFGITIIATLQLGVTIAASLTVAGLGFTMLYAPFVRVRKRARKNGNDSKIIY